MIVLTMSLDTMLTRARFHRNLKNVIGNLDEILTEFDHVALLTQDTKDLTNYFDGITHVPCAFSRSKHVTWILSRLTYIRWVYFFFFSFFWMLNHHAEIKLLISINVDSPAPLFSILFRIPCVVYYHYNTAFQVRYVNKRPVVGSFLLAVERFAFRNATEVWITSPSLMAETKSLGARKVELIPNWVDAKEIEGIKATKGRSAGPSILFVGRLHRVKQVDLLIRAFYLIHERNSNANLYILGEGDQRPTLAKLANDLGLSDSIHFNGYVDQMTAFKMMNLSDVLVLPSKVEGNPRVLIEAMVNRIPIVATNVPGIRDMVQHMKTGYLIDNQEPEELAQAIEYVVRNKQESANMTRRAYAFAAQNFSKENVTKKIRDEVRSLLSSQKEK